MRETMLLLNKEIRFVPRRVALVRKGMWPLKADKQGFYQVHSSALMGHVAKIFSIDLSEKTLLSRNHHLPI